MKKRHSTKKALMLSLLSLIVCVSMLVGTTFAWFTDSVTSSGNIIKSGTLDVEMYWAKGTEDPNADATAWTDASTGAIFNNDLWEPGYTEVRHIKISNVGTLALKYQLNIFANGDVSKLADAIDVYFVDPAVQVADRTALNGVEPVGTLTQVLAGMPSNVSGDLNAGDSNVVTLALKMRESAGNEYQGLEIGSDFVIQLLATQDTVESDSFDDQYDANAKFLEVNESAAIVNNDGLLGEEVVLTAKMPYGTMTVTVPAGARLSSDTVSALKLTVKNADPFYRGTLSENQVAYGYEIHVDGISDNLNPWIHPDTNREIYNSSKIKVSLPVGVGRNDLKLYQNALMPNLTWANYDIDTGLVTFERSTFTSNNGINNYTVVYTKLSEAEKQLNEVLENITAGDSVTINSTADNMVSVNNIADALKGSSNIILVGNGTDNTVVTSTGARVEAEELTFSDMTLISQGDTFIVGSGTTMDNVVFDSQSGTYGLRVTGSDSTIKNSEFIGNGSTSLMFENNSDTTTSITTVDGCTFKNGEGWGSKGGVRFENYNGTFNITNSIIDVAGLGLNVGPINSTQRGTFNISDSTVNCSRVHISSVISSTMTNVDFGYIVTYEGVDYSGDMSFEIGGKTNTFTDCEFKSKINFSGANYGNKTIKIEFNNCVFNDGTNAVSITAENVLSYFNFSALIAHDPNTTVIVNGTTVSLS